MDFLSELLQCLCQLVRAGRSPFAAVDTFQALYGFRHCHTDQQFAQPLRITLATAHDLYTGNNVIFSIHNHHF